MKTNLSLLIPKKAREVANALKERGFSAYFVGGCVRDLLLEKKPKDWDITTNATPEEIQNIFKNSFYENKFGTVGVINDEEDETLKVIEITPYRLDSNYSDMRHPDSVKWSENIEDDLRRRDFTINAMALSLDNSLLDLFKGTEDIQKKKIRAVGDPETRFKEDALRMLRAIRIAVELNFIIEAETQDSIARNANNIKKIAPERIREEFTRIIMSKNPHVGIVLCQKLGLLKHIIPELENGIKIEQNQAHSFDVFEHILRTLEHSSKKNFTLKTRLASIFHDIGKPATRCWSNEKKDWTFYGHDVIGAKITAKIMARLAFPSKLSADVVKLVRWHMFFSDTEKITLSAVRRIVARVGKENIWDLMDLRTCDRIGTGRPKESPYRLRKYHSMIDEVMRDPLSVAMLKIKGGKIIEITKMQAGPKIGQILHALLEEILDDPSKNTEEYLENRAIELAELPEKDLKSIGEQGKKTKERKEERDIKEIRKKHWVS